MIDRRRSRPEDAGPATDLAPFIAWLASRLSDEPSRRRCRLVVEAYQEWRWSDGGPVSTRRNRFVTAAVGRLGLPAAQIEEALDRWSEHGSVVARTLPRDA